MPDPPHPQPPPPLAHPVGVLYEIRWTEICPWLILVKALRVTLLLRVLVLATIGAGMTQWGGSKIDRFFSTDDPASIPITDLSTADTFSQLPQKLSPIAAFPNNFVLAPQSPGPFLRGWHRLTQPFFRLAARENSWQSALSCLAQGLWTIAVWALFGGAIVRIAAIYLTRGETLGPVTALRDALTVWPGTAGAPLITLLVVMVLAIPLVMLGALVRLNSWAALAGLLWCLVLAWGFLLAVLLVGLLLGWPLMWACQGVERSDAFDGVSRCYAYVYQRPLHLAFFVLVAALLGCLGETVVAYFSAVTVSLSEWTLCWGLGEERSASLLSIDGLSIDRQASAAPRAVRFINGWKWGLMSLTAAYPFACLWPLAVGIYLLLRRQIDATEMDEVALSEGTQAEGTQSQVTPSAAVQSPSPSDPTAHA